MKKLASIAVASLCILSACHNKSENTESQVQAPTTADSLRVALADQDSLLSLMNEVADGMAQIKQMENALTAASRSATTCR